MKRPREPPIDPTKPIISNIKTSSKILLLLEVDLKIWFNGYQLSNKISKFLAKNSHTQRKYTMSTYTYRVKESQNLILSQVSLAKTI